MNIPKAEWGDGPWQEEPDRLEFEHAGFACLLNRNRVGSWCCYVAVPRGHPAYGKPHGELDVNVHWGLTYGGTCDRDICHTPREGMPHDVYWLGFDCAHVFDVSPALRAYERKVMPLLMTEYAESKETYRDLAFARKETESLAEQLQAMVSTAAS